MGENMTDEYNDTASDMSSNMVDADNNATDDMKNDKPPVVVNANIANKIKENDEKEWLKFMASDDPDIIYYEEVGKNILKYMQVKGYTTAKLLTAMNFTPTLQKNKRMFATCIRRKYNGVKTYPDMVPKMELLIKFADTLDISLDMLLSREPVKLDWYKELYRLEGALSANMGKLSRALESGNRVQFTHCNLRVIIERRFADLD